MRGEQPWEGIHPDSLFFRSIEQVKRDWGLDGGIGISHNVSGKIPDVLHTEEYEMSGPRCEGCRAILEEFGPDTPLPRADCYGGTGLGVWLDSFLDRNYFPGIKRGSAAAMALQESHWRMWQNLGITNVISSNPDMYERLQNEYHFSITMAGGSSLPFISRLANGEIQVNSEYTFYEDLLDEWEKQDIVRRVDSAFLDELLEVIQSLLPELNAQNNARNPNQRETLQETERKVMTELQEYLLEISRNIDGANRNSTLRGSASLSLYEDSYLDLLFEYVWPLIEQKRLRLMPDLYNYVPSQERFSLWKGIADRIRERTVTNTRANSILRNVRPFIEMKCHTCDSRLPPHPSCSPSWLVCDMVTAALLGFGGPYLYLSFGVDQRFYEAAIIGSWLMGCSTAVSTMKRPGTLGELSDLLCTLFPRVDDAQSRQRREEYLRQFPAYLANPRMYDNPMTCLPCCTRTTPRGEELCNTFDGPYCKENLPCCQPIQQCNLQTSDHPCRPGPHP